MQCVMPTTRSEAVGTDIVGCRVPTRQECSSVNLLKSPELVKLTSNMEATGSNEVFPWFPFA